MIKDKLEGILRENLLNRSFGDNIGQNVLVIGPTGTGKTAQVKKWCDEHKDDINVYHFLANTRPHMMKMDTEDGTIKCLFCQNEINAFNKENTILVIDHFDLTDNEVRNELMSLIKERTISAPYVSEEKITVDKFWYVIAIAYPDSHFGYDQLSKEDKYAFDYIVKSKEFVSYAKTEEEFIEDVAKDIFSEFDDEDIAYFKTSPEYEHFGIGMYIRNEYLWGKKVPSLKQPDDLSPLIYDRLIEIVKNS